MAEKKETKLNLLNGYLFPSYTTIEWLEEAKKTFKPRDTDLFIVSFSKSGTHWLAYTIYFLIYKEKLTKSFFPNYANFFEIPQVDAIQTTEGKITKREEMKVLKSTIASQTDPRIFTTHFPYEHLPCNTKTKYLYIYRNPKDVVISTYHHIYNSIHGAYQETFEVFFDTFIETDLFNFCMHFKAYLEHKDDPNYFILSYEELKRNFKTKVQEISTFLSIELTEELYALIEKETEFETMKANDFINSNHIMQKGVSFFPKGVIGTWKSTLSKEQSEKIDQILLSGLGEEMVKKYFIFS